MAIHRQWLPFVYLAIISAACEAPPEGDTMRFFDHFKNKQSELGTTKLVQSSPVVGERGPWVKMLNVSVPDEDAALITVSFRSEYDTDPATGLPAIGQPLVGSIQWGVGGAESQVEFDIPAPKNPQGFTPIGFPQNAPMINIGGSRSVSIYCSHVSVYARHDGNMSPLVNPPQQAALIPPQAPNDRIGAAGNPAKILAFIGPGVGPMSIVERTIYAVGGNTLPALATSQLAPGVSVLVSVPPFTHAVRFQRGDPNLFPLDVLAFSSNAATHRTFSVPINSEAWYPIDAATVALEVFNRGAVNLNRLQLVFDVTPS